MLSSHLRAALIGYDEVCEFLLKCNLLKLNIINFQIFQGITF